MSVNCRTWCAGPSFFSPENTIRARDLPPRENGDRSDFQRPEALVDPDGEIERIQDRQGPGGGAVHHDLCHRPAGKDRGGNVTRAAEMSGLGRASLQKIMRRLGIRSELYKTDG